MNEGMLPGLTKKEQREIKDSKILGIPTGGLEAFAGFDLPGVIAANALEASGSGGYGAGYRESPGALSAEPMANVQPKHIAALNLINFVRSQKSGLFKWRMKHYHEKNWRNIMN